MKLEMNIVISKSIKSSIPNITQKIKSNFQFFLIIFFTPLFSPIFSQSIITDRPDQTESAVTVDPGILQIESGLLSQVEGEGVNRFKSTVLPTNLLRYGISNNVELRLVLQLDGEKTTTNTSYQFVLGNVEFGTKIVLNKKDDPKVQFALLSHVKLPKNDWGNFSENLGFINRLSLAHDITNIISIGYNFGYDYFTNGQGNYTYTVALGIGVSEKLSIYGESFGSIFVNNIPLSNFDYGLAYLVKSNIQFDLSFGLGLNNEMNYQSIGISWRQKPKEN